MSLKELRIEAGLSQSQLAVAADVKVRSIQQYEQGVRDINGCHLKTLIKLSEVLDCKVVDLLTDQELIESLKKANIK